MDICPVKTNDMANVNLTHFIFIAHIIIKIMKKRQKLRDYFFRTDVHN